ncbi:MAG: hypothetical protein EBW29_00200 [Candidatus Fonsibacter ubiquis]|nr:hypothetical protein [Candidatus Fonsibacter ubiquis]
MRISNILLSLPKTLLSSVIATLIFFSVLFYINDGWTNDRYFWSAIFRYFHVLSGIMWIGLLWYFNFVQIPSMPKIPDEQKPAIGKVIAPTALFWFRWAALFIIECDPEIKAKSARTALLVSRTNTFLSIPMLLTMVAAQNLY